MNGIAPENLPTSIICILFLALIGLLVLMIRLTKGRKKQKLAERPLLPDDAVTEDLTEVTRRVNELCMETLIDICYCGSDEVIQ